MDIENLKREAAFYVVDTYVRNGMRLGLSTDSTTAYVVERLRHNLLFGHLQDIVIVPTSVHTTGIVQRSGIPINTLETASQLDLYIGSAGEVDPDLNLIMGHGGSPLHEKMVAAASLEVVIVATENARVKHLGTHTALPVEISPFGWGIHMEWLAKFACTPILRRNSDETLFTTDSGNYVLDCSFPNGLPNILHTEFELDRRLGIIANGLFLNGCRYRSYRVVIATFDEGIQDTSAETD